jgi:hypothetical protein
MLELIVKALSEVFSIKANSVVSALILVSCIEFTVDCEYQLTCNAPKLSSACPPS